MTAINGLFQLHKRFFRELMTLSVLFDRADEQFVWSAHLS